SVAVGDFNGDGRPDFAVNSPSSNLMSIFTNAGSGNFTTSSFAGGGFVSSLVAGDFNGDGGTDLGVPTDVFTSSGFTPSVHLFAGQTVGPMLAGPSYALGMGDPVAADFNGDGQLDLAGYSVGNVISAWPNSGNGTFPIPSFISGAGVTLASQASGDF